MSVKDLEKIDQEPYIEGWNSAGEKLKSTDCPYAASTRKACMWLAGYWDRKNQIKQSTAKIICTLKPKQG